jgi:hypothetical protein
MLRNRISLMCMSGLLVLCAGLLPNAWAQCTTDKCNPDDIFVDNFGGTSNLVRFSKADIAANGNAATGVIIASGFGSAEGMTLDFDGTVIVTTRFTGNVERVCRDGSQRAIEALVTLAEGPSYAPNGDLFLNNTGPTCETLKAPPPAGGSFTGLNFAPWITIHPSGTFCEDTRISPPSSPVFPGELYVERNNPPSGCFGDPTTIDAFSASAANTLLGAVIPDFGTAMALGQCQFQSLGFAFDSQGDIWVPRWLGPLGMELVEFTAATNFAFSRAVAVSRPGGGSIPDFSLAKVCITPPDPSDPLNPGNDTILVTDSTGPFLHIVDEVSGATLASVNSNLVFPAGVACCDVIVGAVCDPDPRTQGYWHRQCLGVPESEGGIDPGREGRGPQSPTEPGFVDELMPCADDRLEDLGFYGLLTCEGMDAYPPSDACERAEKQLTALILNVCSGRLQDGCEVDVSAQGCASTNVGDLIEEIASLIFSGDCQVAAACAGEVNEGTGVVVEGGAQGASSEEPTPERVPEFRGRPLRSNYGNRR